MKNSDNVPTTARRPKWWRFAAFVKYILAKEQWVGLELKYHGKTCKVIAANYDSVQLEGFNGFINKRNWKKINDGFNHRK